VSTGVVGKQDGVEMSAHCRAGLHESEFLRAVSHSVGAHAVPAAATDASDTDDDDDDQDVNGSNQLQTVCPVSAPPSQDMCEVCLIEQRDARDLRLCRVGISDSVRRASPTWNNRRPGAPSAGLRLPWFCVCTSLTVMT